MPKWVVKRVKSESKPKPKMPIEMKPIVKIWKLKLPKPIVREPTVVTNPVRSWPLRRPRRSKQQPIDANSFVDPARLTDPDLDKKSTQCRVARIQHFKSLKSDFPVLDKTMYNEANKSSLGVSLRRFQEWFHQYDEDVDKVKDPKPKAKKEGAGKAKREAIETATSKCIEPNSKRQFAFPPAMPKKQAPKNGLGHQWSRQGRASDSNRITRSPLPALLEDHSIGNCILLWLMWSIKYNEGTQTSIV